MSLSPPLSESSARRLHAVGYLIIVALLALLLGDMVVQLADHWWNDPTYSHGILVLPISLGIAFFYMKDTKRPLEGEAMPAALYLTVGVAILLLATVLPYWHLQFLAWFFLLWGVAVAVGGHGWARGLLFPTLFLFFMFPLPENFTGRIAVWLQSWVSELSEVVLSFFVVVHRKGALLYLPGLKQPLFVAEECSGLRQIVAFLALGALAGHFSGRGLVFRGVLLVMALPVALFANTVRVVLMGLGSYYYGTAWLDSWMHHAPAIFCLPLGLVTYYLLCKGINKMWPVEREPSS